MITSPMNPNQLSTSKQLVKKCLNQIHDAETKWINFLFELNWNWVIFLMAYFFRVQKYYVLTSNKKIIGVACVQKKWYHPTPVLNGLFIDPEYQRKGFGKMLFTFLKQKYPNLIFTPSHSSKGFYERVTKQ